MLTTIPAHSLGNTTFFLHTFIINLHSSFFFILTHLYSYFVIHFYPLKSVDQTVESLYFLNIFSQRSSLKFVINLFLFVFCVTVFPLLSLQGACYNCLVMLIQIKGKHFEGGLSCSMVKEMLVSIELRVSWKAVTRYICRRGTLGGTQYRNTVRKKCKYRNTVCKIYKIPIPHFQSATLHPLSAFSYLSHVPMFLY